MKNHLLFACLCLSFIFCSRNKDIPYVPAETGEGLCIYSAVLDASHRTDTDEIDVNRARISGKPIVAYRNILSYDTANHVIRLSIPRDSLPPFGFRTPFLVMLDSVKMYGGWFFSNFISSTCSWVVIIIDDFSVAEPDRIRIGLGYPTERFFVGRDPRGNSAITRRLKKDGKAI